MPDMRALQDILVYAVRSVFFEDAESACGGGVDGSAGVRNAG